LNEKVPTKNAPVHAGTMGRAARIRTSSLCSPHTLRFFTVARPHSDGTREQPGDSVATVEERPIFHHLFLAYIRYGSAFHLSTIVNNLRSLSLGLNRTGVSLSNT